MTIQDELIRRCVATQRWRSSWRGNPEEEVPDLNRSSADARLVFVVWWGSLLAQVHDRAASWMKSKQTRVAFFVIGNDRGDRIIFECHAFDDPQRYGLATTVTVILYFVENRTGELITIAQQTLEPSSQIPHFSRETWEQVCAASRIFLEGNGPKRKVNKEEKTVSVANPIGEQSDPLPKSKEFPPGVYRITRETRLLHDPRPDAEVVTQLTAGRRVRVVGSVEGAWLKVESSHADRPPGYVRAEDVGAIQENSGRTK